jgi:hypothetical protein
MQRLHIRHTNASLVEQNDTAWRVVTAASEASDGVTVLARAVAGSAVELTLAFKACIYFSTQLGAESSLSRRK